MRPSLYVRKVLAAGSAYRRVRLTGRYLHDKETLVQAVTEFGGGSWVLTPMVTPQGTVLVNRGFVAGERRDAGGAATGTPSGETQVTGLLRISEPGDGFLRRNDPAAGRWYTRDVAAIAAARGLTDVAPFFVDADAASSAVPSEGPGGPRGGLTVVAFNNHHLIYAVTWFVLSLLAAGAGLFMLLPERRR